MRTIAIINQKGGCGKTTTTINLGGMFARAGKRTLLVDMDPQSHCAAGLGVPDHKIDMDIGDAMLHVGTRTLDTSRFLWHAGRNLDLAPSRMRLAGLEAARGGLANLDDKEQRLRKVLAGLAKDYDLALVDCSPAIGLLTFNALAAADVVLIPVETSFFSLQGATRQVNTIRTLAKRLETSPAMWLLPTIHDESSPVANDLLAELRKRFGNRVAPVIVRRDPSLKEAASFGQTIIDYDPNSSGAQDYGALASWLLKQQAARANDDDAIESEAPAVVEVLTRDVAEIVPKRPAPLEAHEPGEAVGMMKDASPTPLIEPKPEAQPQVQVAPGVSRAEDVARRAQQFLRRLATTNAASTASLLAGPSESGASVSVAEPPPVEAPAHPTLRVLEAPAPPALHPNAVPLLGARETRQGVLFVQPMSAGRRLAIAGDFNNWSPATHAMAPNETLGVYEVCVKLPPGRYRYRVVIDGKWQPDPHNNAGELNPFGEVNSIVNVTDSGGTASA